MDWAIENDCVSASFQMNIMYLLTNWEGGIGNYLAHCHGIWTVYSKVCAP